MNRLIKTIIGLTLVLCLASMVVGVDWPTQPSGTAQFTNYSNGGFAPTAINLSRGLIYDYYINESQPTIKWMAFVGNISGEFALQDSSSRSIYDWDITTVRGEVYAEREYNGGTQTAQWAGKVVGWANLTCANESAMDNERSELNHTGTDEDALNKTFFQQGDGYTMVGNDPYVAGAFYAGNVQITGTLNGNCWGTWLNVNNTDNTTYWEEVMLTDNYKGSAGATNYRIIYAGIIRNNGLGFNEKIYDYQLLLPTWGAASTSEIYTVYNFYTELV